MGPGIYPKTVAQKLLKTEVNLKIIPGASGGYDVLQLVGYNLQDVQMKGAWVGPARLDLVPHVNAPVADLPVKKVIVGLNMIADLVLPSWSSLFFTISSKSKGFPYCFEKH